MQMELLLPGCLVILLTRNQEATSKTRAVLCISLEINMHVRVMALDDTVISVVVNIVFAYSFDGVDGRGILRHGSNYVCDLF
jgi:hypothetical protein